MSEMVSVEPLKQKLEQAEKRGILPSEVCAKLGWMNTAGYGDTSKLKRTLGMVAPRKGVPPHKQMKYEIAVEICHALNVDPHEVNI